MTLSLRLPLSRSEAGAGCPDARGPFIVPRPGDQPDLTRIGDHQTSGSWITFGEQVNVSAMVPQQDGAGQALRTAAAGFPCGESSTSFYATRQRWARTAVAMITFD
jgi:hypothetical protein